MAGMEMERGGFWGVFSNIFVWRARSRGLWHNILRRGGDRAHFLTSPTSTTTDFTWQFRRSHEAGLVLVELAAEAKLKCTSAPVFITYETEIATEKWASGPQERDQQQENDVP